MAVGAGVVFPRIAPVGASADDCHWCMSHSRIAACGFDERLAEIAGAQLAQTELGGAEMVHARRKARGILNAGHCPARKVGADDVEFDFIKCAGAGGGTKKSLSLGMFLASNDARGKEQ